MPRRRANDIFNNIAGDSNQANVQGQTYTGTGKSAQMLAQLKQKEQMARAQQGSDISGLAVEGLKAGGKKLYKEYGKNIFNEGLTGTTNIVTETAADTLMDSGASLTSGGIQGTVDGLIEGGTSLGGALAADGSMIGGQAIAGEGLSLLSDTGADALQSSIFESGASAVTDVATEAAAEGAMGSMSTGGAGLVDTGVTMAAGLAGVDSTTAEIGGDAAGLAMATAAGGPIGAGVYAGSQLLTKGKFMGLNVGSIF